MSDGTPTPFWRRGRLYFRRLRLAVWSCFLLFLALVLWLNQAGLPGFLKRPLLDKLRADGVDLQFRRIHLSLVRGVVAEDVSLTPSGNANGPQFRFAQGVVGLKLWPLLHRKVQIDTVELRAGRLVWPIPETNAPNRELVLDQVQTELRFLAEDRWELDNFHGSFSGMRLQMAATVRHASALRNWSWFKPTGAGSAKTTWPDQLRQFADVVQQLQFTTPPELWLDLDGDARDPWSFRLRLSVNAPDARTPWGSLTQGQLIARLRPADSARLARADVSLNAAHAETQWGNLTNFTLHLNVAGTPGQTNVPAGDLHLEAGAIGARWGSGTRVEARASFAPIAGFQSRIHSTWEVSARRARCEGGDGANLQLTASAIQSLSTWLPLSVSGQVAADRLSTPWGGAQHLRLKAEASTNALAGLTASPAGAWSKPIQPYLLDWDLHLAGVEQGQLSVDSLDSRGHWQSPIFSLTNLDAVLAGGHAHLVGRWNAASGQVAANGRSDLDPARLSASLPEKARSWLKEVSWSTPPQLELEARLTLPPWTNLPPDWWSQVQPSFQAHGKLGLPARAAFRDISVSSARTGFAVSNQTWELSDLEIVRPDGRITGTQQGDLKTGAFHVNLLSSIDPGVLIPALPKDAQEALGLLVLSQPPELKVEAWGSFEHPEQIGVRGSVRLTNFTFRGEAATGCESEFAYTNLLLQFFHPRVQFGSREMHADGLAADLASNMIYLTNGVGNPEPMVVARAIGAHIGRALEPYQFLDIPFVRGYGAIPIYGEVGADLHFQIEGQRFHWLTFDVRRISGHVRWTGPMLYLEGVRLEFYEGDAFGSAAINVSRTNLDNTPFAFSLTTTNTDLNQLVSAVSTYTNHLEGRLSGTLEVTNANSADWRQTGGYGRLVLKDGLVWDIPLFGIFSRPLDSLTPGLGTSRVSGGNCTFIMTNGVLWSDDLELTSPAFWLLYRGSVDLQQRVNARVEVAPLHDKPVLGPFLNILFRPLTKLFEYKVTGQLSDPRMQQEHVLTRLILMPLHPISTLRSLFPEAPRTNAPPGSAVPP